MKIPARTVLLVALLALSASTACEEDAPSAPPAPPGTSGQGGASGAAGSAGGAGATLEPTPTPPAPPAPPAPPVLTPCPERWTEKELEGAPEQYRACHPPELPDTCPAGMMAVLGESECQPVGDPCPAGDFPDNLPNDRPLLHVRAGNAGGDGSQGKPFGTISEAVKAAKAGTVIAIAKGVYPEIVTVGAGKDLTLWGACAAGVTVQGSAGELPAATIEATGTSSSKSKLVVKNLSITGERMGALFLLAQGTMEGVVVHNTRPLGIGVAAATVTLRSVLVSDTRSQQGDKNLGRGLNCQEGAKVTVERSVFERNRQVGVFAFEKGTSLQLTDVVIRGTQSRESDRTGGRGLTCQGGAKVTVERSLFDHNRQVGVFASGADSLLTMRDVIIQDTQSQESDKTGGLGLGCEKGSQVTVERARLDHNRDLGAFALGAGTSLQLTDVVIKDTQSQESDRKFGQGIHCQEGATVKVQRALLDRNRQFGAVSLHAGASLSLTDALVQNTQAHEVDGEYGAGLTASTSASLSLLRVVARRNLVAALLAQSGSQVSLSSVWLTETLPGNFTPVDENDLFLPSPIQGVGDGLVVLKGSSVSATDLLSSGNQRAGLLFSDSTGSLTSTTSTSNQFGMVLRGLSEPSRDESCSFEGNETPILPDGDLPVPNAPLPTPVPLD